MTHALQQFIRQQMDERRWVQADLVRESGLLRAHVSKLLNDDRDRLPRLPDTKTVDALAAAFNLDPARVMLVAVRATGVEDVPDQTFVYGIRDATDDELLTVLRERLVRAQRGVLDAPSSITMGEGIRIDGIPPRRPPR